MSAAPSTPSTVKLCLALLAASAAVRVALAVGTDIYFDEAYYWQWSRRLAGGYFDHPPLVAWLIALLGIRPAALLCGAGTVAAVWGLARDVHGSREAAWRAAALWSVVPAGVLAGVWNTPDTPLLLFWALALWALWRERWVLAGLACGLALLGKYPAVLLALVFLATAARNRRLPAGAWVTAGLAALLFLPVVLWNARHEWVGFAFQLKHGLGGSGGLASFAEYLAGQLALGGPVLLPLAGVYVARGPREQFLLRAATAVPLLFFGYAALKTRGEANWPAVAYVAASVGVAGMRFTWVRAAAFSGLALILVVGSHLLVPVLTDLERDVLLARTHGWDALKGLSQPSRLFPGAQDVAVVYAPSYQLASQAALYAGVTVDTAGRARRSQYDLWPRPEVAPGQDAFWYSEGGDAPPDELVGRFTAVEGPVQLTSDFRGRRVHTFDVWWLRDRRP